MSILESFSESCSSLYESTTGFLGTSYNYLKENKTNFKEYLGGNELYHNWQPYIDAADLALDIGLTFLPPAKLGYSVVKNLFIYENTSWTEAFVDIGFSALPFMPNVPMPGFVQNGIHALNANQRLLDASNFIGNHKYEIFAAAKALEIAGETFKESTKESAKESIKDNVLNWVGWGMEQIGKGISITTAVSILPTNSESRVVNVGKRMVQGALIESDEIIKYGMNSILPEGYNVAEDNLNRIVEKMMQYGLQRTIEYYAYEGVGQYQSKVASIFFGSYFDNKIESFFNKNFSEKCKSISPEFVSNNFCNFKEEDLGAIVIDSLAQSLKEILPAQAVADAAAAGSVDKLLSIFLQISLPLTLQPFLKFLIDEKLYEDKNVCPIRIFAEEIQQCSLNRECYEDSYPLYNHGKEVSCDFNQPYKTDQFTVNGGITENPIFVKIELDINDNKDESVAGFSEVVEELSTSQQFSVPEESDVNVCLVRSFAEEIQQCSLNRECYEDSYPLYNHGKEVSCDFNQPYKTDQFTVNGGITENPIFVNDELVLDDNNTPLTTKAPVISQVDVAFVEG